MSLPLAASGPLSDTIMRTALLGVVSFAAAIMYNQYKGLPLATVIFLVFLVVPVYLGGLLIVPYVVRSPYKAIRDRKIIWVLFMSLMIGGLIVTFIGSFFRGPGWNWVWPWDGLYFTL